MRTVSYFELVRGKTYKCNIDCAKFNGKFEYKLHKHYLVYRKIDQDGKSKWSGVWNVDWYNEMKASYKEVEP